MASIEGIILAGKGEAGSGNAWRVTGSHMGVANDGRDIIVKHLFHHGTHMLSWREDNPSDENYLDYHLGWGSVSDQGGMNTAFRILAIPLYYERSIRNGGPRITKITKRQAKQLRRIRLDYRRRWGMVT